MTTIATVNNKGINAMSVSNMTATRMAVINKRTADGLMAVGKAMMIETLKAKMQAGVAHFAFQKKDGSIREVWGTIQGNIAAAKRTEEEKAERYTQLPLSMTLKKANGARSDGKRYFG